MDNQQPKGCDDELLVRSLDNDLNAAEEEWLASHLEDCRPCRRQLSALSRFSHDLKKRVDLAADAVDFTALEKDVLTKALRQHRFSNGERSFVTALKYGIPAVATACLLLFLGYNHYFDNSGPAPSAIINSFTGSMSSVMIFETPETRQTILWYNENTDGESESDAV